MVDRLMVTDIKQEITDIQTALKHMNEEAGSATTTAVVEKRENSEAKSIGASPVRLDENNDKYIKCEPDVIASTSFTQQIKTFTSNPMNAMSGGNAMISSNALDDKSRLHETLQKDQHHSHHMGLDLDYTFENHSSAYDIKKELEHFDIESEITPSYIIKKCDASLTIPPPPFLPPVPQTATRPTMPSTTNSTLSTLSTTGRDSLSELDSSDFNYLYSSSSSATSTTANSSSNRKKDEMISCDKEPYDEWLCIQKELNLITEKRASEQMPKCNLMDGYMDTCATAKLSVENHFPDLFNHQTNHHDALDDKTSIHSPLSELFNEPIGSNAVGSVSDKTVESHLENMFSDSSEFEKTNDLVESRLEELFHGSSSPVQSTASQACANQVFTDRQQHVANHTEFMMMHPNAGVANQMASTVNTNKRHWTAGADLMETMTSDQLLPQKRSCMMNTYIEAGATNSEEHHWMMDCQQSSTFDFMTGGETNLDITSANNKRLWNGTNDCPGSGGSSGGSGASVNNLMNGLPCDINNGNNDASMLMNNIDPKKQCYNNAVKNHDLELTLLGCTSSLHNENSFDTSTMAGSGSTANTSNNSIASNFEDDINRHVQNAIDSILNLQNSESEALHYLDQTMGSFLNDSPLVPNYSTNPGVTSTITHSPQSSTLPSTSANRTQHHMHQQTLNHHQSQQHHYDDTNDCLISGSRSGMNETSVDMMIDSPPTLITS